MVKVHPLPVEFYSNPVLTGYFDRKYEPRDRWSGGMSGFTLYYSHFTDIVDQEGHNFPLSPGLIPIVYFQNVERVYLGAPFTSCISADAVNSYE